MLTKQRMREYHFSRILMRDGQKGNRFLVIQQVDTTPIGQARDSKVRNIGQCGWVVNGDTKIRLASARKVA